MARAPHERPLEGRLDVEAGPPLERDDPNPCACSGRGGSADISSKLSVGADNSNFHLRAPTGA